MMPTIEELDRVRLLGFQEAYLGGAEPEQATYASIAAVVAAWTEALAGEAAVRYPFGATLDDRDSTIESVSGWLRSQAPGGHDDQQ
jgi:hypothetical protein